MVVVIETDAPGEGNRHVAGANIVMTALYAIAVVLLAKALLGTVRTTGFDGTAVGISWTLVVVLAFASTHAVAAYGARRGRQWARTLSRVLAFLLFPAVPIGTAYGMSVFRNTRPGRWISATHTIHDAP